MASISKPTGYVTLAKAASTLATTTDTQLGQLRALELPGYADRGRARSVINALGATAGAGRTLQAGAETSDPAVTANASRAMSLHAKDARAKAEAFGFSACVSGMQPGVDAVVAGASGAVKQSFIEKGELLCTQWLESGDALPQPRSLAEGQHFFRQVQAVMETFTGGLKALPVAPGDEAVVAELLAELAKLSGAIKQLEAAAINGDVKRVNAIDKEGDAIAEAIDRRLSAYGFSSCGPDD